MDWGLVDERLIGLGELLLSPDFLESYYFELSAMNDGKVGSHKVIKIWKFSSLNSFLF